MNSATQVQPPAAPRATLGLFIPAAAEANSGRWRINGYPARIYIWTVEEWDRLAERPSDAQYYACGVWCALRME